MDLKDIKKYRGYMPVRMEREDVLYWLGELIGGKWINELWQSRHSGYHEVRYRFGDIQEAQLYMKDKSWKSVPIGCWLKFTEMDVNVLDDDCWRWVINERSDRGVRKKSSSGGLLEI